jgi:hypothetical protein
VLFATVVAAPGSVPVPSHKYMFPVVVLKYSALVCPAGACASAPETKTKVVANIMAQPSIFLKNFELEIILFEYSVLIGLKHFSKNYLKPSLSSFL